MYTIRWNGGSILVFGVFLSSIHHSWSLDSSYEACMPQNCGTLDITHPFYIIGVQESYCGYPDFGVVCDQNNQSVISISGDSYVIQNISYNDQSIQVINSAFLHPIFDCTPSVHNFTLNDARFQLVSNQSTIVLLLHNCVEDAIEGLKLRNMSCISENETQRVLAGYEQDFYVEKFAVDCQSIVEVPYEGRSSKDVEKILRRGIVLNWSSNNCSACITSGGRCGQDKVTLEAKCFCPDKPHIYSCGYNPFPSTLSILKKGKSPLILGLAIVSGLLIGATVLAICLWRKKLNSARSKYVSRSNSLDRSPSDVEKGNMYFGVPLFSYNELREATDQFDESKELGDGGFGTVYYGKLKDGREVAVKRLYEKNYRRVEQFMNEVQLLTCLRHSNLVSLYGCTSHHSRELLLVYEYVSNGTVADHLYGDKVKDGSLTWPIRLRIARETANALSYLHASDIIHRDIKTNNILLDNSFSVKVADFGLSRLFPTDVTHISTAPQGTPGYLDPEYGECYQLTSKSDVYSFGVVLIELISSLPAVDFNRHRHEINLSNYAMTKIQRCAFEELVDPQLGFTSDAKVRRMTTSVCELAFRCLQHDKEFRPSMDEVFEVLKRIESSDHEALQVEEIAKNETGETVVNSLQASPTPTSTPTPTEDNVAKQQSQSDILRPSSPISVMGEWSSKATTPSSSKS